MDKKRQKTCKKSHIFAIKGKEGGHFYFFNVFRFFKFAAFLSRQNKVQISKNYRNKIAAHFDRQKIGKMLHFVL